ncbi:NXPE family member 2-like isoform X2 [Branchiostoma lanceolatum]
MGRNTTLTTAVSVLLVFCLTGMMYMYVQQFSTVNVIRTELESQPIRISSSQWQFQNGSIDLEQITKSENFVISVVNPRSMYRVGRQLSIKIVAMDTRGRPKSYGGDVIRVKLYTRSPVQASTAGRVTDYGNGTYLASFFLSFPGRLSVAVKLVHSSEALQLLKRFRDVFHVRRIMVCRFHEKNKNFTEWMPCSNTFNKSITLRDVCDFSRPSVNATFYCQRPRVSHCDSIGGCHRDHEVTMAHYDNMATEEEKRLFPRDRTLAEELPRGVSVQVRGKRKVRKVHGKILPPCGPRLPETASEGYWFNGTWTSLRCYARRFRTIPSAVQCLQNKTLFFRGDSTTRQWWRYLMIFLKLQQQGHGAEPLSAIDEKHDIKLQFSFHHFPRNQIPPMDPFGDHYDMHYIAEEIDGIVGGPNVVIVIGPWAHFMAEPIETFRSRLYGIRHAIERLHNDYPETKIIWRTPNTVHHDKFWHVVENSDFYGHQLLLLVKEILGDLNIAIIDVWEMSESMWHDDDMHPPQEVIKNHIDLLLSYICSS